MTRGHGHTLEARRLRGSVEQMGASGHEDMGAVRAVDEGSSTLPKGGGQARSARSADPTQGKRSTRGRRPYPR